MVSSEEHFEKVSMVYTILSICKMVGIFVLTKWYIRSESTESWRNFRTINSQEYIPLEQFQYNSMNKSQRSKEIRYDASYCPTVEIRGHQMVIKINNFSKPPAEAKIECDDEDILVSTNDVIGDTKR